jgi:hypothetical protein
VRFHNQYSEVLMTRRVLAFFLLALLGVTHHAHSQAAKPSDPRSLPYDLRDMSREAGNVGGWWALLNENEKSAFLSGYQAAMKQGHILSQGNCKFVKEKVVVTSDQKAFDDETNAVLMACLTAEYFEGFEKITTQDLDVFYLDRANQAIPVEWSMDYLRDKLSGKKTRGQLLDVLDDEQKEVHDCGKYPSLCKIGVN